MAGVMEEQEQQQNTGEKSTDTSVITFNIGNGPLQEKIFVDASTSQDQQARILMLVHCVS